MKIYDISQEVFSCRVFPGTPEPKKTMLRTTAAGDRCNLTVFSMCAHNGTHADAPFHFLGDGKTIDQIDLSVFVGECYVVWHNGDVTRTDAENILQKAAGTPRILIAGSALVTKEAAQIFAQSGICLIGNESQAVGSMDAPMEVHKILMEKEIILLEGLVLGDVPEGRYLLNAAPLNLGGSDGAPCRAILIGE